ncbi:glycosyltransferase [Vibrio breoganii]|uniref:glycosyltransferase n=1 Tax=Vibrio breoganii TaxID=553239 RepID=UPI000C84DB54|nr:glycosyltransferase [Vibrio breoganii]PMG83498.1 hypothetical protein BCU81_15050 [Vibrio breoganii]
MKKISLKIIVVLYNKRMGQSDSLLTLMKQDIDPNVVIYLDIHDNSPVSHITSENIQLIKNTLKCEVNYNHDPSNSGISKIYANAIKSAAQKSLDYVLMLDDDTCLPSSFIDTFYQAKLTNKSEYIFVPKVYCNENHFSPYRARFVFTKPYDSIGLAQFNNVSAINSGTFLPVNKIILEFRYPDYCDFYGTDTVLFEYANKKNIGIFVLDTILHHDLSFHPDNTSKYLVSLDRVIKFWRRHYARGLSQLLLELYLILLSVKLSIKYKRVIKL